MSGSRSIHAAHAALLGALLALACSASWRPDGHSSAPSFEYAETRELVAVVDEAARLVESEGEEAFDAFRVEGSRWRRGEDYVFVLDPDGKMVVHPDPAMEGRNQLSLEDVHGKPIVRGLLDAAMTFPEKPEG